MTRLPNLVIGIDNLDDEVLNLDIGIDNLDVGVLNLDIGIDNLDVEVLNLDIRIDTSVSRFFNLVKPAKNLVRMGQTIPNPTTTAKSACSTPSCK